MLRYVIRYTPGKNWISGKPASKQPLKEHIEYQAQLYETGVMVAGGPFIDNSGGMLIFEAESIEHAKDILNKDPAVISKVYRGELSPWYIVHQKGHF